MGGRAEGGGNEVASTFAATWGRASRNKVKRIGELNMGDVDDLRDMPEEEEDGTEPAAGASGSGMGARSRSVPPAMWPNTCRSRAIASCR